MILPEGRINTFFHTSKNTRERGHEMAQFCMQHPKNEKYVFEDFFIDGVTSHTWEKATIFEGGKAFVKAIYNTEAKRKFEKLVDHFKPDVVHIQNMFYQISPSILGVTEKLQLPVIETLHDYHLVNTNNNLFHHGKICEDCIKGSEILHTKEQML